MYNISFSIKNKFSIKYLLTKTLLFKLCIKKLKIGNIEINKLSVVIYFESKNFILATRIFIFILFLKF